MQYTPHRPCNLSMQENKHHVLKTCYILQAIHAAFLLSERNKHRTEK